jgi:hypothetical protein
MSSDIIYHQTAVRIPVELSGLTEDLFIHLAQAGSSNCFEMGKYGRCGRRSRSWQVVAFGTAREVLTEGIKWAGSTEGGGLKLGSASAWATPEKYIRKVRSVLKEAAGTDIRMPFYYQQQFVNVNVAIREPRVMGAEPEKTRFDIRHAEGFKAFMARYLKDADTHRAHDFFEVQGPELR